MTSKESSTLSPRNRFRSSSWAASQQPCMAARLTSDIDIVYDRSVDNIQRLVDALAPLNPYLRGAPPGLPFRFDSETVRRGLNFTLTTSAGPVDLLGELTGIGLYRAADDRSIDVELFGRTYRCLGLGALIDSKRAAGRIKDLEAVAELEQISQARAGTLEGSVIDEGDIISPLEDEK